MADQVPFPGPHSSAAEREAYQTSLDAARREAAEAARARRGYAGQYKPGDGATRHIGTDAHAFTVTRVSPTGKTMWVQRDKATLDPGWKPDFHPGGFVGHVSNNHTQAYTYERDPGAPIFAVRLTQRGWAYRGLVFTPGRHEFHDYNF